MHLRMPNLICINKLSKRTKVNELMKRFMNTEPTKPSEKIQRLINNSSSDNEHSVVVNEESDIDSPVSSQDSLSNSDNEAQFDDQESEDLDKKEILRQVDKEQNFTDILRAQLEPNTRLNSRELATVRNYRNKQDTEIREDPIVNNPLNEFPDNGSTLSEKGSAIRDSGFALLEKARNLFKSSEDMVSKLKDKSQDGNSFIDKENTYHTKENFNSTVPAFVGENSAILLATDNIVKGINYKLGTIAESLHIQVEKSEKLGEDWNIVMKNLQAYRKSLEGVNLKKVFLTLSASIAIVTFMYKMGVVGKLAKFGLGIISEIGSSPNLPGSGPISPFENMVDKLKVPDSKVVNNVMENALTPGIIIGVGISLGTLMIAAKVLRALRFIIKK
jgi:tetrahydromethanopterin S-methyltransferase subunit B